MTEVEKKKLNYLSHISWRTIDNEIWKKTVNLVKTGEKMSSLQCDETEIKKKLETEWSQFLKQNQELLELFDRLHRQGYDDIVRK